LEKNKKLLISFLLPAFNEEKALPEVISSIPITELKKSGFQTEIVVVDNNSNDKTASVARSLGARVVSENRRGYGHAYQTGFQKVKGDIVITGDADNTYPFGDSLKYVNILLEKDLLFITTNRFANIHKDAMSLHNRFGNWVLKVLTNFLFGLSLNDASSGMWVFKTDILEKLSLKENGMALSQEIKIAAFEKLGKRSAEIPVDFLKTRIGKAKLRPWRDGLYTIYFLVRKKLFSFKK
jgi:glycosyltransferase involved in cell wall biosynthesis